MVNSPSAPDSTTPPPQMNRGCFAFRNSLAANSTIAGSGATRRRGTHPAGIGPHVASTGRSARRTAARYAPRRGGRWLSSNALRKTRGMSAERSSTAFHLVSGFMSVRWSSSVSVNFPREETETSVLMARTGMEDSLASTSPGRMWSRRAAARRALAHADLAADARIAIGHVSGVAFVPRGCA